MEERSPMTRMQTRHSFRPLAGAADRSRRQRALALWAIVLVASLLWPTEFFATRIDAQTVTPAVTPTAGGTYIVQPGDSWTSLSRRTGIPIRELQAANPGSVRPTGWLIVGEELTLPGAATPTPEATATMLPTPETTATEAPIEDSS